MPERSQTPAGLKLRNHPHLMELNAWAWLGELSRRAGRKTTLAQVPTVEWDQLKALGFDLVWFMGVWKRSAAGRAMSRTNPGHFQEYDHALPGWNLADVVGSPYSIQDYMPDPDLGDWDQLDWVRKQLNQRGMGLILDFVPNHTGPDHAWVQSHPEYYMQVSQQDFRRDPASYIVVDRDPTPLVIARGKDPYFPAWPDTAQLNYFNMDTRAAMAETAHTIAQHADGARCDMAMLIVNEVFARTWGPYISPFQDPGREFWPDLIASLPGFVWIAEVYWDMEWQLQQ
ncbi:MAG: alpha-amylase family glycosyl hydrolase, partial [Terriglobia bacterium]